MEYPINDRTRFASSLSIIAESNEFSWAGRYKEKKKEKKQKKEEKYKPVFSQRSKIVPSINRSLKKSVDGIIYELAGRVQSSTDST